MIRTPYDDFTAEYERKNFLTGTIQSNLSAGKISRDSLADEFLNEIDSLKAEIIKLKELVNELYYPMR
jgi:hypothetical protein